MPVDFAAGAACATESAAASGAANAATANKVISARDKSFLFMRSNIEFTENKNPRL
jgi:hypothetical protein